MGGYCRGGGDMLVCRLMLGHESSTQENRDGDHIWVPSMNYYVISSPPQVLPQYIIKFSSGSFAGGPTNPELEKVLRAGHWTTIEAAAITPVPRNRPCVMSRPTATVLWIGFLHAHLSDE